MKKLMAALVITAATLAFGCGGKAKKTTTPDNKTAPAQNGSTGGATYGGAMATPPANGGSGSASGGAVPADPCVGK